MFSSGSIGRRRRSPSAVEAKPRPSPTDPWLGVRLTTTPADSPMAASQTTRTTLHDRPATRRGLDVSGRGWWPVVMNRLRRRCGVRSLGRRMRFLGQIGGGTDRRFAFVQKGHRTQQPLLVLERCRVRSPDNRHCGTPPPRAPRRRCSAKYRDRNRRLPGGRRAACRSGRRRRCTRYRQPGANRRERRAPWSTPARAGSRAAKVELSRRPAPLAI